MIELTLETQQTIELTYYNNKVCIMFNFRLIISKILFVPTMRNVVVKVLNLETFFVTKTMMNFI